MEVPKPKRIEDKKLLNDMRYIRCCVCWAPPPSDPSHIRSVGSGGPDSVWNVVPMCRRCHMEWHKIGWIDFCEKHEGFALKLNDLGWEDENGTLWHPGLVKEPVNPEVFDG